MKWVVIGLLAFLFIGLVCCGGCGGLIWLSIKPTNFPEQTEEYVDARKSFQTKLTVQGPAPQNWAQVKPPAGVREVTYTSGKLNLKAWVDAPAGKQPLKPAVLYLHGGFAFDSEDWDQCKPFRDAGFVTMTPILRGENGQPGSFSMFYDEVDDVVAAAEALAATPGVDPNRIFVAGHSAGGTLAMLAAMTSKRFKGCASFSGSPDQQLFVRMGEVDPPFNEEDFKELSMRSPLAFPRSFNCPARLYWGDDELFVFGFATRKLAEKARAAGKDVQSVEIPGDHFTAVAPAMRQAVTFFQQESQKVK
jgi:dipeptidyl aminopeptidase/acylaminoacyl peptidase